MLKVQHLQYFLCYERIKHSWLRILQRHYFCFCWAWIVRDVTCRDASYLLRQPWNPKSSHASALLKSYCFLLPAIFWKCSRLFNLWDPKPWQRLFSKKAELNNQNFLSCRGDSLRIGQKEGEICARVLSSLYWICMFVHFPGRGRDKKKVRSCHCRRYLLLRHHPQSWRKKSKERRNRERLKSCCAGFTPISREWASPPSLSETPSYLASATICKTEVKSCGYQNFLLPPSPPANTRKVEEQGKKCLVRLGARNPEPPSPVCLHLKCTRKFHLELWKRCGSQDGCEHKGFCNWEIGRCTEEAVEQDLCYLEEGSKRGEVAQKGLRSPCCMYRKVF